MILRLYIFSLLKMVLRMKIFSKAVILSGRR